MEHDSDHKGDDICERCLQDLYRARAAGGDTNAALVHAAFMMAHGLFAISTSLDDVSTSLDHVAEGLGYDPDEVKEMRQGFADLADDLAAMSRPNGEPNLRIITPNGPETVSPDTDEEG